MLRILFALLFVLFASEAEARFTTFKYNCVIKILDEPSLRSDLNWINYRLQNEYGPKLNKEYSAKLATAKPLMHPVDVGLATDQRKDDYFKKSSEDLAKLTKPMRDRELMFIIDNFEDAEMERIKNFYETYPKFEKALLDYDNYRTLTYEVHAIFTQDHRKRWDIAADISALLLQARPLYIVFADEKAENAFYNNLVNYLTNNFEVKQLGLIKEFLGSPLGQKYLTLLYRLFNDRYHAIDEAFKKNYNIFVELEQEKKSDKESQ